MRNPRDAVRRTLRTAVAAAVAMAAVPLIAGAPDDAKATAVLTAARKAIGDKKLEAVKTFSVEAALQRNVGEMQMNGDVEIAIELPDKYIRSDQSSGPMPGFSTGFNGDKPIRPANATSMAGGAMIIRIGPGGPPPGGPGGPGPVAEKLTPEQQEQADRQMLRSARADISRLMLGWFAAVHPSLPVTYTYAGEAESPEGKADVIDAKNADGFAARLFVDQQTHLPLMVTYQGPQPRMIVAGGPPPGGARGGAPRDQVREMSEDERKAARETADRDLKALRDQPPTMTEFTLFFDDWREAGGVRFPHKMRRAMAGATNEEWTVTRVKVNPKLDPAKFKL